MTDAPRVLLINDNSAHPNWGAQATPFALKRLIARSIPGCEIVAVPWDWLRRSYRRTVVPFFGGTFIEEGEWKHIRPLVSRISVPVSFYPDIADDFDRVADLWLDGLGGPDATEFIAWAKRATLVVYNGENSIYRNTIEGCHGLFLLWLARTRLGKPSCLVNHTCDLNEVRPIMNAMVGRVGPVLDLVAAREPRSLRNLHDLGVRDAVLYPDIVFAEDPADASTGAFDEWATRVGLADRPYFCLSASGLPVSAPSGDDLGAAGELVEALQDLGVRPVLVARDPHCEFLSEVAARTGGAYFGPEHGFAELWPLFRGAAFSVTGHFHYAIFGAMVGCPFIPLSTNNHKMQGACEMLQWHLTEPFDVTWLRSCQSEIVAEAQRLLSARDRLSGHLVERSIVLRAEARRLGHRLREIAEPGGDGGEDYLAVGT